MEKKWLTFSQASRFLNKNRNYVSNRFSSNRDYFLDNEFLIIGDKRFISLEGIEHLKKSIKKMDAHIISKVIMW